MKKFLIASVAVSLMRNIALGQDAPSASASPSPSPAGAEETERVVVQSQEMDITREQIVPSLGATRYTVGPDRLDSQAEGENAPFNQTLLRFPGVAQDSFGQLHVRGEHANLQYRIDDVLLPESIPGFGQVLETRFADNISLITGALPAQFGFRNTGVIDIHTKSGAVFQQGDASVYGGSFDTIMPSFEYGGVAGKLNYYFDRKLSAQRHRDRKSHGHRQPDPRRHRSISNVWVFFVHCRRHQPIRVADQRLPR